MDPKIFAMLAKLRSEKEFGAQLPQQAEDLAKEKGQVAAKSVKNPKGKCKTVNAVAAASAQAEVELQHAKARFAAGVQTTAENETTPAPAHTEAVQMPAQTMRQGEVEQKQEEEDAVRSNGAHASSTRSPPTQSPTTSTDKTFAEAPAVEAPARSPPDEILDIWMQVIASFLGVPALGRLACTASRFRTILPSCVSTLAAQASNQVIYCAINPSYQERLTDRYDRLTAVE